MTIERIVLAGLSGTGKSTVARLLAQTLNWTAIDVDKSIEIVTGEYIPALFATRGEADFRQIERGELVRALDQSNVVIATGGGAVVADDAWSVDVLGRPGTLVITLDGEPAELIARLRAQVAISNETVERPLLAGDDPLGRMIAMKAVRQPAYDRAHLTIPTGEQDAYEIASSIAGLILHSDEPSVVLEVGANRSEITVRPGIRLQIGDRIKARWPNARSVWIVTERTVGALHAPDLDAILDSTGFRTSLITVEPGEQSKSWSTAGDVIGKMLDGGIQRNDVVVALGGGVIGDLAGFAASSVLRGVGLVQVPTSLLAMVDSSVGGKTGVNHDTGKNLIGSFYQPHLVLIDPEYLRTLPPRELNQGWAEVVKHAFIQPSTPDRLKHDLWPLLERNHRQLQNLQEPALSWVIARNVELKASVVREDEREKSLRAILNFGHTLGHAIEASEYRYLHGEAIALGLRAAIEIGRLTSRITDERAKRMNRLISDFDLPRTGMFDPENVRRKMQSDKKNTGGKQTWVLPMAIGGVDLCTDIEPDVIEAALASVRSIPL